MAHHVIFPNDPGRKLAANWLSPSTCIAQQAPMSRTSGPVYSKKATKGSHPGT